MKISPYLSSLTSILPAADIAVSIRKMPEFEK